MAYIKFIYSGEYFSSTNRLKSMFLIVSTEGGKTVQVDIPVDL